MAINELKEKIEASLCDLDLLRRVSTRGDQTEMDMLPRMLGEWLCSRYPFTAVMGFMAAYVE